MKRPQVRKKRLLVFRVSRLFPNMVTIVGLSCGLTAMRLAMEGKFEISVVLLIASAVIDGMDGRIARLLNSTSMFGAQLDSLSDFVCFGVSPAIVLYLWKLNDLGGLGWLCVLFYAVCCALRLARFNTALTDESRAAWQMKFFTGIPSPAGAMLALMPLVFSFESGFGLADDAWFCALWMMLVAALMTSRIPTFAVKKLAIRHEWVLPIMLVVCCVIGLWVVRPWVMFNVTGGIYLLCLPLSVRRYRRYALAAKQRQYAPV
jgi:CDP-diacylglycerol--serine O-phosphatidyltransferase